MMKLNVSICIFRIKLNFKDLYNHLIQILHLTVNITFIILFISLAKIKNYGIYYLQKGKNFKI